MPPAAKKAPRKIPTSIDALLDNMTKRYGSGAVTRREEVKPYEVIPTGSMSLDVALRVGGWVRGRIHEIVGPEGQGKTTLCLNSAAQAQRKYSDLAVGFIDMEQTLDWDWAEAQGLDTSRRKFVHTYPDNSEDVSDQLKEMIETGLFSAIIIDSIGGMESLKAFEKDAEDNVMGKNAQVITRMVKQTAVQARKHNTAVLAVNQLRADLNGSGYDQSAGPKAFKYSTTSRVEMRRTGTDPLKFDFKDGEGPVPVGLEFKARVTRNKVAAANKSGTFWIVNQVTPDWGPLGIDQAQEAFALGEFSGAIDEQPGNRFWLPWTTNAKERIHGEKAVLAFLRANPDKIEVLKQRSLALVAGDVTPETDVIFTPEGDEIDAKTGEVLKSA